MVGPAGCSAGIVRVTKLRGGTSRRRTWRARSFAVARAPGRTGDGPVVAPRIAILPGASRVAACLYPSPPSRRAHEVRTGGSQNRPPPGLYPEYLLTRVLFNRLGGWAGRRGENRDEAFRGEMGGGFVSPFPQHPHTAG